MGPQLEFIGDTEVLAEGKLWTFFGGNDYHRFSRNPEVAGALIDAVHRYGINSGGSRITTANHTLYLELEAVLADYLGTEDAVICSAGYLSSTMLVQSIADEFDLLLIDEIAHGSLVDAALQSGKPVVRYAHRDAGDLERSLRVNPSDRPLVLTDGVFASSGGIAPLAAISKLITPRDGRIVIDDAHGVGVIGATGKGSWEDQGIDRNLIYQTGTLSKGLGGFGGFFAGSRSDTAPVRAKSRAFMGSTPVPLPVAAASIRSIQILKAEPDRLARIQKLSATVKPALRKLGFKVSDGAAPICSVTHFDSGRNAYLADCLCSQEIYPSFIDYPGSPPGGHFRFTLSSAHTAEQIDRLMLAVNNSLRQQ